MIYAYDNWAQMPSVDLYDTQMMAMALNAAKDMYEKGEQRIKDFKKEYGDFMSPFAKDMARYGQIVGDVRNTINDLYARGIDPLRSSEGRAIVQSVLNKIDPAEMSRMKANAKVGYAYLDDIEKAKAANQFNEDYENFLLRQAGIVKGDGNVFDQFSSADGNMFTRSAAGRYSDLNQYTGHIFDKLDDSFIRTGEDHYDYYGVTREDRAKALTPHLSGLLQSPLGRFHYENSKAAAERALGRRLTDQEAMQAWQNDILDATHEYDHENRKLNELWKLQQENAARLAASRVRQPKEPIAYDSAEGLFYRGLMNSGGTSHYAPEYLEQAVEDARDNIVQRQIDLLKQAQQRKLSAKATDDYILDGLSMEEAPDNFFRYAQIAKNNDGSMVIDDRFVNDFFSEESIVTHLYGINRAVRDKSTGKIKKTIKQYTNRKGLIGKRAIPTRVVRTPFNEDANGDYAINQFWKMDVGHFDDDGNWVHEKYMGYKMPTSRESTHNMPSYAKYRQMNDKDKNVIIRPSLAEKKSTLGWKNSGSMEVNMKEHAPVNIGFPGTSNNEAYETQ